MSTTSARRYDGAGRRQDAENRRQRIVEAATALFLEQGVGTTSIEQIAKEAGTSAQTVYAAFGSKVGVLARAIDVAVGGDEQDVALMDRPEHGEILALGDVEGWLRRTSELAAQVHGRSGALLRLLAGVAGADPAAAELHQRLRDQLRADADRMLSALPAEALRTDLTHDELVDLAMLVAGPESWAWLVLDQGWSPDRYASWLEDALRRNLLGEGAA